MIQKQFAENAAQVLGQDASVIGLSVGGSWLGNELDEFSDLDLLLVTKEKISHNVAQMLEYAGRLGSLLNGFTGEHVGEPRLLICLYNNPLLHVDIKFLTLEEFSIRIEDPVVLLDTNNQLKHSIEQTPGAYPFPGYQWMEDRFWTWIHYGLLKIGRGEYMEAVNFLADLRRMVLGPLLHIKNGNLPRGVRKLETVISHEDMEALKQTLPAYHKASLIYSLEHTVSLYRKLRSELFTADIVWRMDAEKRVMEYAKEMSR